MAYVPNERLKLCRGVSGRRDHSRGSGATGVEQYIEKNAAYFKRTTA